MPQVMLRLPLHDTPFFFKGILLGYVFNFHLSSSHSEFVRPLLLNDGQLPVVVKIRPSTENEDVLMVMITSSEELDTEAEQAVIKEIQWELGLTDDTMAFHHEFHDFFPNLPLGYRVTKVPLEEMLLTSLLSQNASMRLYALQAARLAQTIGKRLFDKQSLETHVFLPTWETLAKTPKTVLLDCKLGYRVKYLPHLLELVRSIRENDLLKEWESLKTDDLIKILENTKGIGQYTASTIALYALDRRDAFFSDSYIRKMLDPILKQKSLVFPKSSAMARWREVLNGHWNGHAGWMVDFLVASNMLDLDEHQNPHFLISHYLKN